MFALKGYSIDGGFGDVKGVGDPLNWPISISIESDNLPSLI